MERVLIFTKSPFLLQTSIPQDAISRCPLPTTAFQGHFRLLKEGIWQKPQTNKGKKKHAPQIEIPFNPWKSSMGSNPIYEKSIHNAWN